MWCWDLPCCGAGEWWNSLLHFESDRLKPLYFLQSNACKMRINHILLLPFFFPPKLNIRGAVKLPRNLLTVTKHPEPEKVPV